MVKRATLFIVFLSLWLAAASAFAAEFTATVDRNRVSRGENLTLRLDLSGTEARGDPDTTALEKDFIIDESGRQTSTQIVNGAVTSSTGWYMTLIPKQEGRQTIPPVTIDTDAGTLSSEPIAISVTKAAGAIAGARGGGNRVSVSAEADPPNPYKSQPFHYTVTVMARGGVTGIALEDMHIDNAVVDKPDKPKVTTDVENGTRVNKVEFDYIITPLQPGKLVIPPAVVHGNIISQSIFNPFGDDRNDPFSMFGGLGGLGALGFPQPFSISSDETDIDVRPPSPGVNPWLPLYSLQLKDEWKVEEKARVGKPVTRKIMILAEGGTSAELPSLESYQDHDDFKIYADKGELGSDTGSGTDRIVGWRSESYTMIPKKAGTLVIPAVKVPWWDIENNRLAYAELPARTLEVLPGDGGTTQTGPAPSSVWANTATPAPHPQTSTGNPDQTTANVLPPPEDNSLLYGVIATLLAAIGLVAVWAFRLQGRVKTLSQAPASGNGQSAEPEEVALTLEDAATPEDLRKYLQEYGAANWRTPRNAPLEKIFAGAPSGVRKNAKDLVKKLSAAIYAGRDADMEGLKAEIQTLLENAKVRKVKRKKIERLPDLNPS